MESHLEAWLALGFSWRDFFSLTPYATSTATNARSARVSDDLIMGAYQSQAFARTKRMKPLKAYQTKKIPKKDGSEQMRVLQAMGVTAEELEEAQREIAKQRNTV